MEKTKRLKKKKSIIQLARLIVQIIFFITLPALYISAFTGFKQIYIATVTMKFNYVEMLLQLIPAIVIIPFTMIVGRFFCGWMCGLGAYGDFIYEAFRRLFKIKFRINQGLDQDLKYIKYVVLIVLIIVSWTFGFEGWISINPWDVFGTVAIVGKTPAISYAIKYMTVGFILFVFFTIGSIFIERFFCRYFCPLGALFAITSRFKIAKIHKPSKDCGKCTACTHFCSMGIPLYKQDIVNDPECIKCMKCVTTCPKNTVTLKVNKSDVKPLVASAAAVGVMTGFYYAGNLGVTALADNNIINVITPSDTSGISYTDGTYEGSGTGYRGAATTVQVVVSNNKIVSITTVSYGDDKQFYDSAFSSIKMQVISSQSAAAVDAVSGATFSSNGIISAIQEALSKANSSTTTTENTTSATSSSEGTASTETTAAAEATSKPDSTTDTTSSNTDESSSTSDSTSSSTSQASSSTSSSSSYKSGTYTGSGTGYHRGTTTVSVTVKDGKITDITTVSTRDDEEFYDYAFQVVTEEIIQTQSTSVNAVSGATFSSNGIMEAVADALSNA